MLVSALLAVAAVVLVAPASPVSALGPNAMRAGFDSTDFPGNDDQSTGLVPLGFSTNFFGNTFTDAYVNNNGNITFDSALGTYTPFDLTSTGRVIIAPFFSDVDTRVGTLTKHGTGTVDGRNAFGVTWPGVGCFSQITSVLNHFQLILVDRSDIELGDFDIEFNYDQIQWETGQASGGDGSCQGGSSARAGFSNGTGAPGTSFELPGSAAQGAFLDSSASGLIHSTLNSDGQLGRYRFHVRGGEVVLPDARVSIDDVSVEEGDSGSTPAAFTISLSAPAGAQGASVKASTTNGTAAAPGDYAAQVETLVEFAPGETAKPLTVQVAGDVVDEPDETFIVSLSSPVNIDIEDDEGTGTIVDDDRDGKFACRASALRALGVESLVANAPSSPCRDAFRTGLGANLGLLGVSVRTGTLNTSTDQSPNDLEATAPAAGDKGVARSSVAGLNIRVGVLTITADVVEAAASVQCASPPSGPALASSGRVTNLRVNGRVVVANAQGEVRIGLTRILLNREIVSAGSLTRRALWIQGLPLGLADIVIAEAKAGFSGNPCTQ